VSTSGRTQARATPPTTRQAAWDRGAGRLRALGLAVEEARLEAEVLLRHAAALSREELFTRPGAPLGASSAAAYAALIEARAAGRPTAYLVGRREFFGFEVLVDERVLIPRPETERLVETVREALAERPAPLIVEIGTGSGAVAIALARLFPRARAIATDCSATALDVARLNAAHQRVADRITWAEGGGLDPLAWRGLEGAVDALVSNPPYIPTRDLADLPREIRDHEPRVALDGGDDGLAVHRRLVAGAARYLRPGGVLALEVAAVHAQARAVAGLLAAEGAAFAAPRIVQDYTGAERIVCAIRGAPSREGRGDGGNHRG